MSVTALLFAAALSGQAAQDQAPPSLTPINQLADEGVETYRATFGRATGWLYADRLTSAESMPTVIFERRPGESPRVIVVAADRRMEGLVSEAAWLRVRRTALGMVRAVGAHDRTAGASFEDVCLGSWLETQVEMTPDWVKADDGTPWRAWSETAICTDHVGSIGEAGDELARIALELLPPCDRLTKPADTDPSRAVARCLWLDGDRLAAAQFLADRPIPPHETGATAREWDAWFRSSSLELQLDWPGYDRWLTQDQDKRNPDENHSDQAVFVAMQAMNMDGPSIAYTSIRGDGDGQVTTQGLIQGRRADLPTRPDEDMNIIAVDHQVWVFDGYAWKLRSWRVEPFISLDEYESRNPE